MPNRRAVLGWVFGSGVGLLLPRWAQATTARALSLQALARGSASAAWATPLASQAAWEDVGDSRRIVTTTRVRVDGTVAGVGLDSEVLVRTLGGEVDDVGQVVHGEARLVLGQASVLFLLAPQEGRHVVMGMAQGHFPLARDEKGVDRLRPSPRLPKLLDPRASAARVLAGRSLADATRLIREEYARAR